MSEQTTEKKQVSQEFIKAVKEYLDLYYRKKEFGIEKKRIDEKLKPINEHIKIREEFILNYLKSIDEKTVDVRDGKLRRNITKKPEAFKKEMIQKALTELFGDSNKASTVTDHIDKSRPIVEKVSLRRVRNKKQEGDEE
jgi:1,2-phenylacetyl-CoA epoxidase catalytic subunit